MHVCVRVCARARSAARPPVPGPRYGTPEDGQSQLYCVSFGSCPSGIDIVRCSYNLAHHWLGYNSNGGAGARLAWHFMSTHPKVADETRDNATKIEA